MRLLNPCLSFLIALAILGPSTGAPASADTWTLNREYTNITFSWDNLGLSRQSARIFDVEGSLEFTPTDPERGVIEVVMKAASIRSGIESFDRLLKSADYFNVAQHPMILFRSSGVLKTGDRTGQVAGELTILGQTKPVTLDVTWNYTGPHPMADLNPNFMGKTVSGFSATARLLRSDWGMSRATPIVSDEIRVSIETELVLKQAEERGSSATPLPQRERSP
jgi:polyisoprenoid-binding protein YceI